MLLRIKTWTKLSYNDESQLVKLPRNISRMYSLNNEIIQLLKVIMFKTATTSSKK